MEWRGIGGVHCSAPVPESIRGIADAIGIDDAVKVLLSFGGARLYLATDPKSRSPLLALIGRDKAVALSRAVGPGHITVPTGKPFLARALKGRDLGVAEIARKLHVTEVTVRRYLGAPAPSTAVPRSA